MEAPRLRENQRPARADLKTLAPVSCAVDKGSIIAVPFAAHRKIVTEQTVLRQPEMPQRLFFEQGCWDVSPRGAIALLR